MYHIEKIKCVNENNIVVETDYYLLNNNMYRIAQFYSEDEVEKVVNILNERLK